MDDQAPPFSLGPLLSCKRRGYLFRAVGGIAALGTRWLAGDSRASAETPATSDPSLDLIKDENRKPGVTDWRLTRVRVDDSQYRSLWIEGYCSKQSVQAGESIGIMVSANPPRPFSIEIFRMGYYGGRGARLMTKLGPFQGELSGFLQVESAPRRTGGP